MNSKITLARISQLVADKCGYKYNECEDVLRQLFKYISTSLEAGESIRIKGLGNFKVSKVVSGKSVDVTSGLANEIPTHSKIVFVPAKELANAVNAPFEMFETVEIEEELLEEELMQAETEGIQLLADEIREEIILNEEKRDAIEEKYPSEFVSAESDEEEKDASDGEENDSTDEEEKDASEEDVNDATDEEEEDAPDEDVNDATDEEEEDAPDEEEEDESDEDVNDATAGEEGDVSDEDKKYVIGKEKSGLKNVVEDHRQKRRIWPWFIAAGIVAIIAGVCVLWWLNDDFSNWGRSAVSGIFNKQEVRVNTDTLPTEIATLIDNEDNLAEENSDMTGLVEEELPARDEEEAKSGKTSKKDDPIEDVVPTKESDSKAKSPKYDTVSTTRYLTTIAKEHYGNYHLWPYIYKENEKILGHPNRIRPGTKVVVPDLSKYNVDPKNPKDIEKAKKLGVEIYNRFKD